MSEGFYYLASPYSKYPAGLDAAFRMAAGAAARFLKAGISVYSPIAHTHPVALAGGMDPLDHDIWLPADRPFMEAAKGLLVYQAEGWFSSYGISKEVEAFEEMGKPVFWVREGDIIMREKAYDY